MKKIKVGVIGAGFFGRKHARVYSQLPMVELAAIADINQKRVEKISGELNCRHYTDYRNILEMDVDVVDIVIPDDLHKDIAIDAVSSDKHILMEKPLAMTEEDCQLILEASHKTDKKFMVGHILRFDPRSILVKQKIDEGEIGEIVHISSRRNSPISGARHYAGHCELATHSGVHDYDLVRWFTDSEYSSVYAKGRRVKLKEENIDMYDSILALFTLENGVIYQSENSWILPEDYPTELDARMQIVGTEGVLNIDVHSQGLEIYTNNRHAYPDVLHWREIEGEIIGHIRRELEKFIESIVYDQPVPVKVEDGYKAALAAINTIKSIENNKEIKF
ncbi:MAG: Gfo/Idh/MocA family protein [bacterium]